MSQRSALARFLFESTAFSSVANRRTWQTVVAASAMLGTTYLADLPEVAAETDDVPAVASSPTAAVAAEVAAALDRPVRTVRVAQAPEAEKKKPPPAPAQGAPARPDTGDQIMQEPMPAGAQLVLLHPELDFGRLEAGKRKTIEFEIANTGTEPLKLDKKKLKSSCKCLTVALPKEPIAAGGKGIIKVTYTAPTKVGDASYTVVVRYVSSAAAKTEASAVMSLVGVVAPRARPRVQPVRPQGRGFILS